MIFNKRKYFLALIFFGFTQVFAHNCKELLSLHEIHKENKLFSNEITSPHSLSGSHDLKDVDYSNLKFTEVEKPGKNSAVYKTEINGEPYYYRPLEKNEAAALNGLAAHELAKALDLPYLAPEAKKVRIIRNGILEEGVLSKSAKGQVGQNVLKKDFQMKETNLDEAQVFTYLTANTDAHLNNFFVNENGQLEFFDFDQSFGKIQKPHIQKKQDGFSDLDAASTDKPSGAKDSKQQILSLRSLERASTVKRETPQELSDLEAASTITDSQRNMPLGLGTHLPSEISLDLHRKLEKLKDFKAQNLSAEGQRLFNERLNDLLKIPTSNTLDIFPKLKSKKVTEESFLNMNVKTKKYIKKEFSPKEFIDEWAYKMKSTSNDYNNPRLQENIRLLKWGADNNLIQIKLTDNSTTPHVREIYLPEPVTVWLPPNGVLSIVSHELDHAADILRYFKKNIEEKNITDLSLKNLAQHIENTRNTHKETFYKEKQAERMARLSEENIAVTRERFSYVYPRITAIGKLINKNQPLTLEQSTQLTKYFKDIFRIEDRYMDVNKRKSIIRETESFMDWAKSEHADDIIRDPSILDEYRNLVSKNFKIPLPQDGKITPDYLKNLLKESNMYQNTFTDSQYEMLVPFAQKAYENLK